MAKTVNLKSTNIRNINTDFIISFVIIVWAEIVHNDLHASDGRETEALNCKPITKL
jgi:hypothetical protein